MAEVRYSLVRSATKYHNMCVGGRAYGIVSCFHMLVHLHLRLFYFAYRPRRARQPWRLKEMLWCLTNRFYLAYCKDRDGHPSSPFWYQWDIRLSKVKVEGRLG